jgi:uncharacterized protein YegJ (DUF2314 family)
MDYGRCRAHGAGKGKGFLFLLVTAVLVAMLYSCTTERSRMARPTAVSMDAFIHFEYAVYLPASSLSRQMEPMSAVRESLRGYPALRLLNEVPKEPGGMFISARLNQDVRTGYAPPRPESLPYSGHGLSDDDAKALQRARRALILDFAHSQKDVWSGLRSGDQIVEEVARRTNGLVWDEETREVFTPDEWRKRRLGEWTNQIPRVSNETVVHMYDTGHSVRAISLGMTKMGLPDLIVEDTGWSSRNQVGNVINLVSQAMAEGASPSKSGLFKIVLRDIRDIGMREEMVKSLKPNAAGAGCLSLRPGKREEGDPANRLLELAFDQYPGGDLHARQQAMMDSFFGFSDSVHHIKHNDELLAASAKAKRELPGLQKEMAAGFRPGEYLEVKAPFKTESGGNEWMWVEVRKWEGNRITGLLDNEPEAVPGLHSGRQVEVRQEDIFDYIHTFPDKQQEGNETSKIIQRMEGATEPGAPTFQPVVPVCHDN